MSDLIYKLKESKILGRSGSLYPVGLKWEAIKSEKEEEKYVVCNGSEGEMETFKDYFLLKNYPEVVLRGIDLAKETLNAKKAFIYLKKDYFSELSPALKTRTDVEIIEKKGGYVGGEETALIEVIEGNPAEPRVKPPFPTKKGLWDKPTLVNNVETFYFVAKINDDEYHHTRFFSIAGDAPCKGVFEFDEGITVKELLQESGNIPTFDYFLQVGGGTSGEIILPSEIERKVEFLGSVVIYNREKTDPYLLMEKWVNYLLAGNCDKCTPCREGLFRIKEMIEEKNFKGIDDLFFVMEKTSLCPLGMVVVSPFQSLLKKIIVKSNDDNC